MKSIDYKTEKELREEVPDFVTMIEEAQKNKIDEVLFMLDAFGGEPDLLYKVLWFAYSKGISVTIVPPQTTS